MKLPTLDSDLTRAIIEGRIAGAELVHALAEKYPDGFAFDTTPGIETPAEHYKLTQIIGDALSQYPVRGVCLPVNRPFTGRYAVFQPSGRYDRIPNPEDHILIARRIGEDFRAVYSTCVPWDDPPLCLWDNPRQTDQVVLSHTYYLVYSLDAGGTFHRVSRNAQRMMGYDRFSATKLLSARIDGHHLEVEVGELAAGRHAPSDLTNVQVWHLPLTPDAEPTHVGQVHRQTRDLFSRPAVPAAPDALLKTDGRRLWARNTVEEPFGLVALEPQIRQLMDSGRMDFFGGASVRSMIP